MSPLLHRDVGRDLCHGSVYCGKYDVVDAKGQEGSPRYPTERDANGCEQRGSNGPLMPTSGNWRFPSLRYIISRAFLLIQ